MSLHFIDVLYQQSDVRLVHIDFALQLFHPSSDILMGQNCMTEFDKGTHNGNVDLNSSRTVQDSGKHGNSLLSEYRYSFGKLYVLSRPGGCHKLGSGKLILLINDHELGHFYV